MAVRGGDGGKGPGGVREVGLGGSMGDGFNTRGVCGGRFCLLL